MQLDRELFQTIVQRLTRLFKHATPYEYRAFIFPPDTKPQTSSAHLFFVQDKAPPRATVTLYWELPRIVMTGTASVLLNDVSQGRLYQLGSIDISVPNYDINDLSDIADTVDKFFKEVRDDYEMLRRVKPE